MPGPPVETRSRFVTLIFATAFAFVLIVVTTVVIVLSKKIKLVDAVHLRFI